LGKIGKKKSAKKWQKCEESGKKLGKMRAFWAEIGRNLALFEINVLLI
jgi:hypothetical protein